MALTDAPADIKSDRRLMWGGRRRRFDLRCACDPSATANRRVQEPLQIVPRYEETPSRARRPKAT
jgi:hypothetical protein